MSEPVLSIEFFIPGPPATQGSMKHVGRGRVIHSNKRTLPWRQAIAFAAAKQMAGRPYFGIDYACSVVVTCYVPRPDSCKNLIYPNRKPDCDKVLRCVLDAMTGIVYDDDSRVFHAPLLKSFCGSGMPVGTKIIVCVFQNSLEPARGKRKRAGVANA